MEFISGLGIDVIDLTRKELQDFNFAKRYMTNDEYKIFLTLKTNSEKSNYMACIWSLKEAIIKATNHNIIFSKINIQLTNEAPQCLIENYKIFLSFSYEKKIATAIAIAYKLN